MTGGVDIANCVAQARRFSQFERVFVGQDLLRVLDFIVGDRADQRGPRCELFFSHWQGRISFFRDPKNIDAPNALDAAFAGVALRLGPAQDHLIAALKARELLGSLRNPLDRRQGRPALAAGRCQCKKRRSEDQYQLTSRAFLRSFV